MAKFIFNADQNLPSATEIPSAMPPADGDIELKNKAQAALDVFAENVRKRDLELVRPTAEAHGVEIEESDTYESVMVKVKAVQAKQNAEMGRHVIEEKVKAEMGRVPLTGTRLAKAELKRVRDIGVADLAGSSYCPHYPLWVGTVLKNSVPLKGVTRNSLVTGYDLYGHMLTTKEALILHKAARRFGKFQAWYTVCDAWTYLSNFAEWCDSNRIANYELIIADPDCKEYAPENCMFVTTGDRLKRGRLIKYGVTEKHRVDQLESYALRDVMTMWLARNAK